MAAFCTCCGAVITSKRERCFVCGAPLHGMSSPLSVFTPRSGLAPSQPAELVDIAIDPSTEEEKKRQA